MADDNDTSEYSEEDEGNKGSNLSGPEETTTMVTLRNVKQKSNRGSRRMAEQILESCQLFQPSSRKSDTDETLGVTDEGDAKGLTQNIIQVKNVTVQGTRNLSIGGTQNIIKQEEPNGNTDKEQTRKLNTYHNSRMIPYPAAVAFLVVIVAVLCLPTNYWYRTDDYSGRNLTTYGGEPVGPQVQTAGVDDACQGRRAQDIMRRTERRMKTWTKGMVKTSALEKVMVKLNNETDWVTIKGSPGEGKTTVGYMALEELYKKGSQVFQLTSPEESSEINMTCSRPVIMLDDIFGDLEFDQTAWHRWKAYLQQFLDLKEHRSHERIHNKSDNYPKIIFVAREYVINMASAHMGKLFDVIMQDFLVVDMSHRVERGPEEKQNIWNAIVTSNGIQLDQEKITRIFKLKGNHGFPHVCRLFATLYQAKPEIDVEQFFRTPFTFLRHTIQRFLEDDFKLTLFKEMIKEHGKVSQRRLEDLDGSYKIIKSAESLNGTYLKMEDGYYMFDHPSIYDSVASVLCKSHPKFVIENCNLQFIHERLRIGQKISKEKYNDVPSSERKIPRSETDTVFYLTNPYVGDLAKRFAFEISNKNMLLVLSHKACTDYNFVKQMMSQISVPLSALFKVNDSTLGETFLTLLASNKSPQLLRYIDDDTDIRLDQHEINTVLYGVYKYAASDALIYLTSTRKKLNTNSTYGVEKLSPLMIAAESRDTQFVHQIMSLNPDVNARDTSNRTALHYLCANRLVSLVKPLIDNGADADAKDKWRETPLCYVVRKGFVEVVDSLLQAGAITSVGCGNGDTSLHYAAEFRNIKCLTLLLKADVNAMRRDGNTPLHSENGNMVLKTGGVNVQNGKGLTPLHLAVNKGSTECVRLLLKAGADVNLQSNDGNTPLHDAAESGSKATIALLLEAGTDLNALSIYGYSPLHVAAWKASKENVDLLLKAGADVNLHGREGLTPLHVAVIRGSTECVKLLLKAGADVNTQCTDGHTPLHCAAQIASKNILDKLPKVQRNDDLTPLHVATEVESKELIGLLLEAGADVNAQRKNGYTPLHEAACQKSKENVDILLKAGSNVNVHGEDGFTALHLVAGSGYTWAAYLLLKAGAFVNAHDDSGITPLHVAVLKGDTDLVDVLLKVGADVNLRDADGRTPLHVAVGIGLKQNVNMLLIAGADVNARDNYGLTPIHTVITLSLNEPSCSKNMIDLLQAAGGDVNLHDTSSLTPLHKAVMIGSKECVDVLLTAGADVNILVQGRDKYSPLNFAVLGCTKEVPNSKQIIYLLSKAGADINVQSDGHSPLHTTVLLDSMECVNTLLKAGANVNAHSEDSLTALHVAVITGLKECVDVLLESGADVNIQGKDGFTPLHFAVMSGSKEPEHMTFALLKSGADANVKNKHGSTPLQLAFITRCKDCIKMMEQELKRRRFR